MDDGLEVTAGSWVGWTNVGEGISLVVGEGIGVAEGGGDVAGKLHATRGKTTRRWMSIPRKTRPC